MSAETAYLCCCQPSGETYYALRCDDFMDNYCCPSQCAEGAVARIEFCPSYLISIGIPVPPDPTKCYYIAYDCCVYVLTGVDPVPCPNPAPTYPQNVGTLVKVKDRILGEDPCCYPDPVVHGDPGGVADLPGWEPEVPVPLEPCEEMIAECYDFYDQFGTVKGKEVNVSTSFTACVTQYGVGPQTRCDHGPPIEIQQMQKTVTQKIGPCICCEQTNGVEDCTDPLDRGPCLGGCPNERRQTWIEYMSCSDSPNCDPTGDCCGNTPTNCESVPTFCDTFPDPLETYYVKTCYSVTDCGNDHEEDVLLLKFPCCFVTNRGYDCTDQADLDSLFLNNVVDVVPYVVNTGWGPQTVIAVRVCDLYVITFSGNAGHIAQRINDRLGAQVTATGIGPWSAWFWFGFRQSCVTCDWMTPNDRPNFQQGDSLTVDRVVYNPTTNTADVYLKASSPRYYVCATQEITPEEACDNGAIVNCGISALGSAVPYGLHCLSMPEYAFGARYTMVKIEEIADADIQICTDINFYEDVPHCLSATGFPQQDVYIFPPSLPPVLVQRGWFYYCPQMLTPQSNCRCYPFIYDIAPCCPPGEDCAAWEIKHPLPEPCVLDCFQDPGVYCQTSAQLIQVR